MSDAAHIQALLSRLHAALRELRSPPESVDVDKNIWSSPAGKARIAKRLAALLPAHKTYAEPFAGSAAVLFAKEPAEVEAINDADAEIAQAYRLIKGLSENKLAALRKRSWVGDKTTFLHLLKSSPQSDMEKLYRFLYVTHFSYGKMRKSFSPASQGIQAKLPTRLEKQAPRLKRVHVHSGDYEAVVKRYDSANTVFFLDPPYAGYDADVGEGKFDEERFFSVLKSIKGKWLLTYGIRGKLPKLLKGSRFNVRTIRTPRTIRAMRGVGGSSVLTQILASNYVLSKKALDACAEDAFEVDLASDNAFEQEVELIKGADPDDERYVLGVVLEPETVDAQGDIYSAAEIRQAAHRFMEEFRGLGLQHKMRVNDQVRILESYLVPQAFELAGRTIHKGTWLLAVRILSDALWQQVKEGEFTGFSIGGSARRVAEPTSTTPAPVQEGEDPAPPTDVDKAATKGSDDAKNTVHRLLDMVVQEVSLVDRAANRQRFLIIKRDDAMSTKPPAPPTDKTSKTKPDLDATASALEELANLVEAALSGSDASAQQSALTRLAALSKNISPDSEGEPDGDVTPPTPEDPVAGAGTPASTGEGTPDAGAGTQQITSGVEALVQLAQHVLTQLQPQAAPPAPTPAPTSPAPAASPNPLAALGPQITAALRGITHAVRTQQQRISRLEKNTGLPASQPVGEAPQTAVDEDVWPLDLNAPKDRDSSDDLSFFDV